MSVESLLDTNVIIYMLDDTDSGKSQRAEQLIVSAVQRNTCCISQQVVQETLNVAIRKLSFTKEDAQLLLEQTLLPLCKPVPTKALYQRSLDVQFRYQYSFYDTLIIAAALELGCQTLYSEDLQHGQQIGNLTIENPFLH